MGRKYLVKTWVGGASERYASADNGSEYNGEQVGNRRKASTPLANSTTKPNSIYDDLGNANLSFDSGNETIARIDAIKNNKTKRIELLDELEQQLLDHHKSGRIDSDDFTRAYSTLVAERNSDKLDTRTSEEKRLERRAALLEEKKQALLAELDEMDEEARKIEQAPIVWLQGVLLLLGLGAIGLLVIKRLAHWGILQ